MARGSSDGARSGPVGPATDELKRHIAQLESALADLEGNPQDVHFQNVFRLTFAAVLALLPASLYTGGTRVEADHFLSEFARLKRNKLVRDNELGIGDLFIRRAIVEWRLTDDDAILDELEGILSERRGHTTQTVETMRKQFGQSAVIHFASETRNRFYVARLRQRVLQCEKMLDGKLMAEAKAALRDASVARLAGAEWAERLGLLERAREFQGSLAIGARGEQRAAFRELLDAAAQLKKTVGSARYREEFQPNLCRLFLSGAGRSASRFVWLNCINFLEALKYDFSQGIAQLDEPQDRLALVNRQYWFERERQTAGTPLSYAQKYRDFFKDYDLRLINPSVGFAAIGPEACLFTPQPPRSADTERAGGSEPAPGADAAS